MNIQYRFFIALVVFLPVFARPGYADRAENTTMIVSPGDASPLEDLAAREVRRCIYQRTGVFLNIVKNAVGDEAVIVVRLDHVPEIMGTARPSFPELKEQEFCLKTARGANGRRQAWVVGGSDTATLYAAYRFAEHLGIRFYLDDDVVPDRQTPLVLPQLDEQGAPLFNLRGIQPFHDFPEGPDWWNAGDYRAILAQLPKLGMNFFGLHTYPIVEPTVWIGGPADAADDGSVRFSYPTRYYNTALTVGWGFNAKRTSDYACGAAALFDRDDYSSDVMRDLTPVPENPDESNEMFNRTAAMFKDAFSLARQLGVKICAGTETPLVVPPEVAQRLGAKAPAILPEGGQVAQYSEPIAGTEDDPLYQSVRFNLKSYRCEAPNGAYDVTLRFCEVAYDTPGARVFGVNIENQPVIPELDIFAKAGKNHALDFPFKDIPVADGRLDIEFIPQTEYPAIAAIEITGGGKTWKVNCGGASYGDYIGETGNALSPEQIGKLYEGVFTRITRAYPLDYYWFWTPETWTWETIAKETVEKTIEDLNIAHAAWERVKPPFQLATCGWVLGPQYDRALLGHTLPPGMAISCINRAVGHDPVEPGFAQVKDRGKWAIPWLEDDPAMTSLQLWAGRMRRDARDALAYGCDGLMGIHWRTRIIRANVAALAEAGWRQADWPDAASQESGVSGGQKADFTGSEIDGADDDILYRTVRWDVAAYHLLVPNNTYKITLKFAECFHDAPEKRVFDVKIEGKTAVEDLDVFARAGRNRALDLVFDNIRVDDGHIDIEFGKKIEFPMISAIVVEGPGITQKINCAGPAYKDYIADLPASRPHPNAGDFYADWAQSEFGPEIAAKAAAILSKIDGLLPRPSNWIGGPGGYAPDTHPWAEVGNDYAFVDEFAALRPQVEGLGNRERFDYWLNNMRFLEATGRMCCLWSEFNQAFDHAKSETEAAEQVRRTREEALPKWEALLRCVEEAYGYLLATVSSAGEMGTVCNFEQHTFPKLIEEPAKALAGILGTPLPESSQLRPTFQGAPRLIVPTKRSLLDAGEAFECRAVLLDRTPAKTVTFHWRKLGEEKFSSYTLSPVRQTYFGTIPASNFGDDFEYYVEAQLSGGEVLRWPPTAPMINHAVMLLAEQ